MKEIFTGTVSPEVSVTTQHREDAGQWGGTVIVVKKGQTWRCSNRECRAEILVTMESRVRNERVLRCWCGAEMKKPYEKPQVRAARE